MRTINSQIRQSGKCNADSLKIPVDTKLNVEFISAMVRDSSHEKIIKYLKFGWPLGHDGSKVPREATRNHKGVRDFPNQTKEYLEKERLKGRVIGPFPEKIFEGENGISPLNSIPQKNDKRRRFLLDLSFPKGKGINQGINKDFYQGEEVKLKYPTVDDLVNIIMDLHQKNPTQKILVWKRDLKSCFRQFHLCPGSIHLVGYKFQNQYWYDTVLAMGSSSSAHICQKITDMARYIFENYYQDEVRNFLDDFFSANLETEAYISFENLSSLLQKIGIEENLEKACPPAPVMTVLGINFNTIEMTLSLDKEKTQELIRELKKWPARKICSLQQMQSLIGKLNFAAGVVRSGRVYMARLINTLRNRPINSKDKIALSQQNLSDVQWWLEHIKLHNGIPMKSLMIHRKWEPPGATWSSDSSKTGLGGWAEKTREFYHCEIIPDLRHRDINSLECLALLLCVKKWVALCRGKRVLIQCDNTTTVTVINSGAAKNTYLQACLREMHHICALNSAEIRAVWIKTSENTIADVLSRWNQGERYQRKFYEMTANKPVHETKIQPQDLLFKYTVL